MSDALAGWRFLGFWEMIERNLWKEISEEIELLQAKLRDNCNVIGQLKREDGVLRRKIKMLKRERFAVAMGLRF